MVDNMLLVVLFYTMKASFDPTHCFLFLKSARHACSAPTRLTQIFKLVNTPRFDNRNLFCVNLYIEEEITFNNIALKIPSLKLLYELPIKNDLSPS